MNLQESIRRILREDKKTKSTNKEFSKYKDSKFNSLRDYTLQDIVNNWESLSDHKNENIKTIRHFIDNPDKITDLVYDDKGLEDGYHRLIAAKILKKPRFTYRLVENLQESIRRILREENYSPAGKEITPNKIVIHKSNPKVRNKILNEGLKARAGECYKIYAGYGEKCIPAIFATNSTNKRAWFDSTYDDDIWEINTEMIPDVKWYKDRHYESRSKHIVTFQDIPKEAITLHYEGTGSGDVKKWDKDSPNIVRESIKKVLKEETEGIDSFLDEISSKHNMSDELKDFVKQFIEESDCKRINFSRFKMGVMGLALESGVLINSVSLNHPLPFLLFLIFHEVAHQYQFKKYGEDVMYDCYLGEISEREAAEFMKQTEEVADEFAGRKIRQLQKLNLIGQYTPPQMYKNVPIQQITMMVNNYREDMRRKNIDSPKKVSEYFYNMVKSEL